ncbi:phytoene desaturase family protein [Pengzhenrongella sicca]|uniref:Pyridine nucleotide-disulfide oxidoreductase domain-containing protein 2 n=1 Tax=Pengzhenrongella sicca TaxID=2819238 RepID=A0A8A4ZHP1_9MICO|nr:FAD-dependent oxidoreductase [Pengzhenrongella sicca]QTE30489.1 NAD(P)/FAD-dependent oxidoreductase [Pengzhenrongella sicca]
MDIVDRSRFDAVVVGGGHNGLTAAAYLARAGRSVLVLERANHLGGATDSRRVFRGVDARLSRYSYLVSLLPRTVRDELGLTLELRRRRISSYTPLPADPTRGLLVDTGDGGATRRSFAAVGAAADDGAWLAFGARMRALAQAVFPTMTGPVPTSAQARALVGEQWWADLHAPLGGLIERTFTHDLVRGVVLTDALIGTFAAAHETTLAQNRCFLYHVIGGGTGDWDVPVGGMGAVVAALAGAARAGGAEVLTRARVRAIVPGPGGADVSWTDDDGRDHAVAAAHVLAGVAPRILDGLLGREPADDGPQGSQLKVNMVLRRLPRLRDPGVDPATAFAGTFHVNESYEQLAVAHAEAAAGRIPSLPPAELYCHTLTDPSILGADLRATGHQTLTLFGLHMPAGLFRADPEGARAAALAATLRSLDAVLAEPIEDCLALDGDGRPCLEVRSPVDLEADVALPGGHIFHRDLQWPWLEADDAGTPAGRWGVGTGHDRVLLCGAGARRGGGVSGIPGRSAAMAVLAGGSTG